MSNEKKDILFKTKLFGFDKKAAMEYIGKIKLENDGLKTQLHDLSVKQGALLKENAMLRSKLSDGSALSNTAPLAEEASAERADAEPDGAGKAAFLADSGNGETAPRSFEPEDVPEIPEAVEATAKPDPEFSPKPELSPEPEPSPEAEPVKRTIVSRGKIIKKKDGKTYITSVR